MTTREIAVKQARPKEDEFRVLGKLLSACELIYEDGLDPRDEERETLISDGDAQALLAEMWVDVSHCWQRVLYGGQAAVSSACDPTLPHLDFKPELRVNPELLEIVRELAAVAELTYGADRSMMLTHLMSRAQAVVAALPPAATPEPPVPQSTEG